MARHGRFWFLLRNLLRGRHADRELDDELRSYLELSIQDMQRAGVEPGDARRLALVELQGLEQVKERVRDVRAGAVIEQLTRDVGYGLRIAGRNRGVTIAAVLTLALGVGAATATFSIVDTIVFRPLPYGGADRLVKIWASGAAPTDNMALAEFQEIAGQRGVFESLAADDGMDFTVMTVDGGRESANGALVTAGWLNTLAVRPVLGRGFLPDEGQPGRGQVVVLTNEYWRRRFNADAAVVGKTLQIDGIPSVIVGVLPPNVLRYGADFLKPLVTAEYHPARSDQRDLDVVARLRPGATVAAAQAEVDVIAARLAARHPDTNAGRRFSVMALDKYYALVMPEAARGLRLMLAAVAVVLLIACVNVANLLIARASVRRRECLIRAALGASRARLLRQLLVEHVVLFLLGGAAGVCLAWWTLDALVAFAVTEGYVPSRMAVSLDARVLGVALAVSCGTGLLFGLLPAIHASRVDLNEGLRDSNAATGGRHGWTRRALIVAELALSLVLLVGFGLIIRSFVGLQAAGGGFDSSRLVETISDGGRSFPDAVRYWQTALDRVRALPGVEAAAVTSRPPVRGSRMQRFVADGMVVAPESEPQAGDIMVSADYFATLGIPILRGRGFTSDDTGGSTPVVVISQTLADRHFPGQDPIGRRLRLSEAGRMTCCAAAGPVENVWREIVGISGDIRQGDLDEPAAATIYRPFTQIVEHDMFLMVKTRTDAAAARLVSQLTTELGAALPGSVWFDVRHTREAIDDSESMRIRRFVLILLGVFAGLALTLAAVGLYAVMAYFVVERRHEMAVRVALGATRPRVVGHVLREAGRLVVVALALGGVTAYFLTRFVATLLYGISPADGPTYVAVAALLAAVALVASYIPASRAARIDPILALKEP